MIHIPGSVSDNLRFLIAEVNMQLSHLQIYLKQPSVAVAKHILDRSGYTFNLKVRIQNACHNLVIGKKQPPFIMNKLKALNSIALDLEQIAELCRTCVNYLEPDGYKIPLYKQFNVILARVIEQINQIEISICDNQTRSALKIGKTNRFILRENKRLQARFTSRLLFKKEIKAVMSSVSVLNSIVHMGKLLLNISEAIISVNLGQPVNMDRYNSLKNSIDQWWGLPMDEMDIKTIAETRSGSGISGISAPGEKAKTGFDAIFKEGKKHKLKEELDSVNSWHEIFPGLAPKIIDYQKQGGSAAILIEHLPGMTYEHILLHETDAILGQARRAMCKTLKKIWKQTTTPEKIEAGYILQLRKRLKDVYAIHPEFISPKSKLCGYVIQDFESLLDKAFEFEKTYAKAPFSVFIHGDFNVDNIMYDVETGKINFIDLHRSRYMDYVQDVSVFMVSNYRLQILDVALRRRILKNTLLFYDFVHKYANKINDRQFNIRLALGLARSFATSTRFILDKSLAESMMIRSRYLLEMVLRTPTNRLHEFQLPMNDLFTG